MAALGPIKVDDIVRVDKKGRIFHALVRSKEARELRILPLQSGITYTTATAHEVTDHWRKTKNTKK